MTRKSKQIVCLTPFLIIIFWLVWAVNTYASGRVQDIGESVVIVLDPGHGGENEGTIENGFLEKEMTLKTAEAIYEELSKYDNVIVYLTREDDRTLTLKERAEFAKEVNADFLFSIHYNASVEHNLFGAEVWISAQAPFNAYGYQFANLQLTAVKEMGLFMRGIKTRLNDNNSDYYGIIREAVKLDVPAVIIEHCHVDEERDAVFCDTDEKLAAFGAADALAMAEYFGLRSEALGVDYSQMDISFPEVNGADLVEDTLKDITPPDICQISLEEADYSGGKVILKVSGLDYDSPLLYYDYSLDGGITYSELRAWPDSDALTGQYKASFSLVLTIPSGMYPSITVRAYNLYYGLTESNELNFYQVFQPETEQEDAILEGTVPEENALAAAGEEQSGTDSLTVRTTKSGVFAKLLLLSICLFGLAAIIFLVLALQIMLRCARKRGRDHSRKVVGDKNDQTM